MQDEQSDQDSQDGADNYVSAEHTQLSAVSVYLLRQAAAHVRQRLNYPPDVSFSRYSANIIVGELSRGFNDLAGMIKTNGRTQDLATTLIDYLGIAVAQNSIGRVDPSLADIVAERIIETVAASASLTEIDKFTIANRKAFQDLLNGFPLPEEPSAPTLTESVHPGNLALFIVDHEKLLDIYIASRQSKNIILENALRDFMSGMFTALQNETKDAGIVSVTLELADLPRLTLNPVEEKRPVRDQGQPPAPGGPS